MTGKELREQLRAELDEFLTEEDAFEGYAMKLPGMQEWVPSPVSPGHKAPVWAIIPYLNDHMGWSRERIADWIDSLHDNGTVDLSFENTKEIP